MRKKSLSERKHRNGTRDGGVFCVAKKEEKEEGKEEEECV